MTIVVRDAFMKIIYIIHNFSSLNFCTKYENGKQEWTKKINIENSTFYYFDDIIEIDEYDVDRMLSDKKSYENI